MRHAQQATIARRHPFVRLYPWPTFSLPLR